MAWFYVEDNERRGPFEDEEWEGLIAAGTVAPETLVWNESMTDWVPLAQARAGSAVSAPSATEAGGVACVECGAAFPGEEMIQYEDHYVCANCKPAFFQKIQEGVSIGVTLDYAGFWIRFAAKIVDLIIVFVVQTVVQLAMGLSVFSLNEDAVPFVIVLGSLLGYAFDIFYRTYFVGRFAATPGKMMLGLKVVTPDGGPVSYLRAFGRFWGEIPSGLILGIGYIMAAFDEEKRTLHDRICGTRVIRKS